MEESIVKGFLAEIDQVWPGLLIFLSSISLFVFGIFQLDKRWVKRQELMNRYGPNYTDEQFKEVVGRKKLFFFI